MILLPTLLGLGALSQAKPVHQRTEGQLLLQHSDSPLPPPACASYHGRLPIRPHTTLYYASPECVTESGARGVPFEWSEEGRLVWVGDSSLDETVDALMIRRDELHAMRMRMLSQLQQTSQSAFGSEESAWKTVLALGEGQGELMLVGDDAFLTMGEDWSFKEMVAISQDPLPAPLFVANSFGALNESSGIPARDVKRVQALLSNLKFSPLISTLLGTFNRHQEITKDVRYLSNEDQSSANSDEERWVSRHSMSEGSVKASAWLLQRFRMYGFVCAQHTFLPHFAPMVECHLPGTGGQNGMEANETVVIGAHFDSRGSFGYPTAPGADDDGSGTALLLALARHIYEHRLTFSRKVVLAAFAGEEQGLLGSKWYAQKLRKENEDVVLMVQVDMIGYTKPGEPIQMARPDLIGLPEAAYLVGNISEIYVPELQVGYTPACCSDHSSFVDNQYAATWVFERNGPIADPCYHNSCDLSKREGYNFAQIEATSKVVLATLLEIAGFSFV